MGVIAAISIDSFPPQSPRKGRRVKVCFHYDATRTINGLIVRDDAGEPWEKIIQLDDGRVVRATECQYQILDEGKS